MVNGDWEWNNIDSWERVEDIEIEKKENTLSERIKNE